MSSTNERVICLASLTINDITEKQIKGYMNCENRELDDLRFRLQHLIEESGQLIDHIGRIQKLKGSFNV